MRPKSLEAVAARTAADGDWSHHLNEFLDDVYAADLDLERQAGMIAEAPALFGHAAPTPSWAAQASIWRAAEGCRSRAVCATTRYLDRVMYWAEAAGLRGYLLAVSPVSFRTALSSPAASRCSARALPTRAERETCRWTYPVRLPAG